MSESDTERLIYARLALLAGLTALVVFFYRDSFVSITKLWQSSDHEHGVLVCVIAAYLVWRVRHSLVASPITCDFRGLFLVLLLVCLWFIARLSGVQIIEHGAVLAMIPATIVTILGPKITANILFPLIFMLFAVPVSDALIPYMMIITADIATALLELSAFPVYREGQYLSLPGGDFVVADVCSGVRYLITGALLAALFGYLRYRSVYKRIVLVAATALAMIITNGVRAYIVMAVASATNMQYLGGRDHVYFGWVLFGLVMLLIMWIGSRYDDDMDSDSEERNSRPNSDLNAVRPLHTKRSWRKIIIASSTLLLLIGPPQYLNSLEDSTAQQIAVVDLETVIKCSPGGLWRAPWMPSFERAAASYAGSFHCADEPVNVFSAAYANAIQGSELISSANAPTPRQWNRATQAGELVLGRMARKSAVVKETHIDDANYNALIWYWYEIDSDRATSGFGVKVLQVLALIEKRPAGGRVIVLETSAVDGIAGARERLKMIANDLHAERL